MFQFRTSGIRNFADSLSISLFHNSDTCNLLCLYKLWDNGYTFKVKGDTVTAMEFQVGKESKTGIAIKIAKGPHRNSLTKTIVDQFKQNIVRAEGYVVVLSVLLSSAFCGVYKSKAMGEKSCKQGLKNKWKMAHNLVSFVAAILLLVSVSSVTEARTRLYPVSNGIGRPSVSDSSDDSICNSMVEPQGYACQKHTVMLNSFA